MDKGLIVKKEWLDRILDKGKVWEMRTTPTKIRGVVGLIESGTGLIVGEVEIVDSISTPIQKTTKHLDKHHPGSQVIDA